MWVEIEEKWNDNWREEMSPTLDKRLSECRNTKADILRIAKLMYKYNPQNGRQKCLDRTISWLCDWNSQFEICPNGAEYEAILTKLNQRKENMKCLK